jgi:hypothetical protein
MDTKDRKADKRQFEEHRHRLSDGHSTIAKGRIPEALDIEPKGEKGELLVRIHQLQVQLVRHARLIGKKAITKMKKKLIYKKMRDDLDAKSFKAYETELRRLIDQFRLAYEKKANKAAAHNLCQYFLVASQCIAEASRETVQGAVEQLLVRYNVSIAPGHDMKQLFIDYNNTKRKRMSSSSDSEASLAGPSSKRRKKAAALSKKSAALSKKSAALSKKSAVMSKQSAVLSKKAAAMSKKAAVSPKAPITKQQSTPFVVDIDQSTRSALGSAAVASTERPTVWKQAAAAIKKPEATSVPSQNDGTTATASKKSPVKKQEPGGDAVPYPKSPNLATTSDSKESELPVKASGSARAVPHVAAAPGPEDKSARMAGMSTERTTAAHTPAVPTLAKERPAFDPFSDSSSESSDSDSSSDFPVFVMVDGKLTQAPR